MNAAYDRITILAAVGGWQEGCWNVAKTGKPFAVEGINPRSYGPFFSAICEAYRYRLEIIGHNVKFNPPPQPAA
jgi:hypothetical protein